MFKKATLGGCLGALTRWATRYRLAQGVGGYLGGGQLLAAKGGQIRQGRDAWGQRGGQATMGKEVTWGNGGRSGKRRRQAVAAGRSAKAGTRGGGVDVGRRIGVRVFGREREMRGQERRDKGIRCRWGL